MLTATTKLGHDFAHESRALGRQKVAHVIAPDKRPAACPLFVLLHPFAGNRFSWINNAAAVVTKLAQDGFVVLPECGRRWFINDHTGAKYETYLVEELIPLARAEYGITGPNVIAGFSMGGAAAFFLACRYPELFSAALAVAGGFTAGDRRGDPYRDVRSDGLMIPTEQEHDRVWGPPDSAVRATYEPKVLVRQLALSLHRPRLYFEVGTEDFDRVVQASDQMKDLLDEAEVEFAFAREHGDHSWAYAAQAMPRLIEKYRAWAVSCFTTP